MVGVGVIKRLRILGVEPTHIPVYHLMIKGEPRPVTLKAALFNEGNEEKLVVGVRAGNGIGNEKRAAEWV